MNSHRHYQMNPRNGHTLVVGVVARISGCVNQKVLSLTDQVDHAREVVAELNTPASSQTRDNGTLQSVIAVKTMSIAIRRPAKRPPAFCVVADKELGGGSSRVTENHNDKPNVIRVKNRCA